MKPLSKTKKVTHGEVQMAVKQFLKNGGIIVRLPDQPQLLDPVIGGEKYQNFDSLATLIS